MPNTRREVGVGVKVALGIGLQQPIGRGRGWVPAEPGVKLSLARTHGPGLMVSVHASPAATRAAAMR